MAYSDFTLERLKKQFNLEHEQVELFVRPARVCEPSETLLSDLALNRNFSTFSAKAKSEFLIVPILRELYRQNPGQFTIFSGMAFDVSESLNGFCDYILGLHSRSIIIEAPVFCLVEAKSRGVEEGIGQCGAEMYAAWQFNQEANRPLPAIYGAVTNGFDWLFMRYQGEILQINFDRFYLGELPELLGALQTIVDAYS
jgi:hypothetical protein